MTLRFRRRLGLAGGRLEFIDSHVAVCTHGNGLVTIDVSSCETSEFSIINNTIDCRRGISALTTHPPTSLLAFAPRSTSPNIYVLKYPDDELQTVLKGGTDIEYETISISNRAELLCAISGPFDHHIYVWSIASAEMLCAASVTRREVPCTWHFCSFNPSNQLMMCCAGNHGITFWNISKDNYQLRRLNTIADAQSDDFDHICALSWTDDDLVLAVSYNHIVMETDAHTGSLVRSFQLSGVGQESFCIFITPLDQHALVVFSDGAIVGLNIRSFDSMDFIVTAYQGVDILYYSYCTISPNHEQLLMTGSGAISSVSLGDTHCLASPLRTQRLHDYHDGLVLGLACPSIAGMLTPVLITAGVDGSLRVWDDTGTLARHIFQKVEDFTAHETTQIETCIRHKETPVSITAVAAAYLDPIVAVGTSMGGLDLIYVLNEKSTDGTCDLTRLTSLGNLRLSREPITSALFHHEKNILAITCASDVYIIDPSLQHGGSMSILAHTAYVRKSFSTCTLWHDDCLLVALADGTIRALNLSAHMVQNAVQDGKFCLPPVTELWTFAIPFPVTNMCPLHCQLEERPSTFFGVSPASCQISMFTTSKSKNEKNNVAASMINSSHETGIVCLAAPIWGEVLATGGVDGKIVLWQTSDGSQFGLNEVSCMNLHVGPVLDLSFSRDFPVLCSSGIDGAVFTLDVLFGLSNVSPPGRSCGQHTKAGCDQICAIPASQSTWHETYQRQANESSSIEGEAHKTVQRNAIGDLRRRIQDIISKNESASPVEALDRSEVVIDLVGQQKLLSACERRAREMKLKLKDEDDARDAISSKIKYDCWDWMEVQATECHAFQHSNVIVANFPLKRLRRVEKKRVDFIRSLRKLELRDIASSGTGFLSWPKKVQRVPNDISWIINQGRLSPTSHIREEPAQMDSSAPKQFVGSGDPEDAIASTSEKTLAKSHDDEEDEDDSEMKTVEQVALDIDSLTTQIYQPLSLRTPAQKRSQQVLICELIRQMQANFNACFSLLHDDKRNEFDRMLERNSRIEDILRELNSEEWFFKPRFVEPEEMPERVVQTRISDFYEKAATSKCSTHKNTERQNEPNETRNYVGKRALQDMMYGTVENRKDVERLQTELQAPSWIDEIEPNDRSDVQIKEFEEYCAAKLLLEQRQEKYRKSLELEFKKLRTEVGDIARSFDERVRLLADRRVLVMNMIKIQEFYMIRICVGLLAFENDISAHSLLSSKISKLKIEEAALHDILGKGTALVDAAIHRVEIAQTEDKVLERNFKRDMQVEKQLDQGELKLVFSHYRDRLSSGSIATMMAQPTRLVIPEDSKLDVSMWKLLQTLRKKKMANEGILRNVMDVADRLKCKHASSLSLFHKVSDHILELNEQQAALRAKLEASEHNAEVLIQVRQGQDELEQEAIVTDYGDAILMSVEAINVINNEICRLGVEQVKTLSKIKHFRKSINFMEWENEFMKVQANDLEEYYTDLQLLHVTKNLQSIMKGDRNTSERECMAKTEATIGMMNRVHKNKSSKIFKANDRLVSQIRGREEENERLRQQLNKIKDAITIRDTIVKSRLDTASSNLNTEEEHTINHMKRITLRRRLIDLARLQTEEIDFLRQELDRLRQRTFPSFAHAAKNRHTIFSDTI